MNIRPLTVDDLRQWWEGVEIVRSVRGFVAEQDGRTMGVAGLMYMPTVLVAFAEMVEEGQQYPLSIMRMARKMRALMAGIAAPIVAEADLQFPNSQAFLERVGFEHQHGRLYVYRKKEG